MQLISLQSIAQICDAKIIGAPTGVEIAGVSTDSRQVKVGDLFVAIRGETFDGHDFAFQAITQGASGVMMERLPAPDSPKFPVLLVQNTRLALGQLANAYRKRFSLPIVAIAGSNGKTTTKEMLAAVLAQRWRTLANKNSFNNDIGVPLTLFELTAAHEVAVLEAGTNHPGELTSLLDLIAPRYGILTSIGREHLEFFQDLEGVAKEEASLYEALPADGELFASSQTRPFLKARMRTAPAVTFVGPNTNWQWDILEMGPEGTRFQLRTPDSEWAGEYFCKFVGEHNVTNAVLALVVGRKLGTGRAEVARGLAECNPPKMRLNSYDLGGVLVLDDCYNANPDSMAAALRTLKRIAAGRRAIAVLGDMAELGSLSQQAHLELGAEASNCGIDLLYAKGKFAGEIVKGAQRNGLANAFQSNESEELVSELAASVTSGDVVLFKASRSARFELIQKSWREKVCMNLAQATV